MPLSVLAALPFIGAAYAGTPVVDGPKSVIVEEPTDWCESIWSLPTLYKNDQNAFIQEFKLIGRFQPQYAWVDSKEGDYDDYETRRLRIGGQAKLFNFVKLLGQINVNDEFDPFYNSIDEAYAEFSIGEGALIVGKHKPEFTYEYTTSSKEIVTVERSVLVNQVIPDKSSGATFEGAGGGLEFSLGLFSGDGDDEFGGFDEGVFSLATIGTDLGFADWRLGYLYNGSEANNNTASYRHSFSNTLVFGGDGPFKVGTDLIYADGFEDDAYGLVILPTYDLTEKLQLVGRYQYAHGDNDSLRAQSRYERRVPDITDGGHGEDYNAFYAGVNYYICGHKLKLMTGLEYSDLQDDAGDGGDFEGWTLFTGLRMYF